MVELLHARPERKSNPLVPALSAMGVCTPWSQMLEAGAASSQEVRMREIEAPNVDQSHQHALARAMRPSGHTPECGRWSGAACSRDLLVW